MIKKIRILFVFLLLIFLNFVSAIDRESCSCGTTTWGGAKDSNIADTCIPKYLSQYDYTPISYFIYGYNPELSWFIKESRSIFSSCPGYSGCCSGKCFDLATEKCCSDFYIPYGRTTPLSSPDDSGLICKKNQDCVDENNDGKSDACLELVPVQKCPTSDELGSCRICSQAIGEISNIPLGTSLGSCSGEDIENGCNEFMCNGYGECISNFSSGLCTPYLSVSLNAEVNGLLVDDFSKLKDEYEINYSEIFPPKLICNASAGNYKLNGDFIPPNNAVNLKFDFIDLGNERIIYSETSECRGNCRVFLTEEKAKDIEPDDSIACKITSDSEEKQSNSIRMPRFYLFVDKIKAFNVIQDVPLVAGKPIGISVYAFFKSDVITNMDKEVLLRIRYSSPGNLVYNSEINFKPMKEFKIEEIKDRIRQNPENPDKRDMNTLERVKNAEDSANFFQLPVPKYEGQVSVATEINPDGDFKESFGNPDNFKTGFFSVAQTRKLRILPVNLIFRDIDRNHTKTNKKGAVYSVRDNKISDNQNNSEYITREITARSMEFAETLYPVSHENVEMLAPVSVIIQRVTDSLGNEKPVTNKDYVINSNLINKVYASLNNYARYYGADYAVGIAPGKAMATKEGHYKGVADTSSKRAVILAGPDCFENKSLCSDNEKIISSVEPSTLAHEFAHINGIKAGIISSDYSSSEIGIASSKGWVINQTSGEGIFPRMNIWFSPGEMVYASNFFDMYASGENKYYKTKVNGPSMIAVVDLLMNSGGVMHVYKEQYERLLNNYKGDSYKYNPVVSGFAIRKTTSTIKK